MIDIRHLLTLIDSIPQDDTLYLLEKFPFDTGLFFYNGNILYLVPNKENCNSLGIKTNFLNLETNVFVSAFNASVLSFNNGYYNYVGLKSYNKNETEENLSTFVNLCLAHATYMQGKEFLSFFDSLVSLFQLPRDQQYKNLIGLMGELLFIEFIYNEYGIDLSTYWHTEGSSSSLDFTSPLANFEVKTTTSDSTCFTIKHKQLFENNGNTYLIAISLSENNSGRTINDLISSLLENPHYCNNLQFSLNIEKEKRRISPIEMHSKRFIIKKILAYQTKNINPFCTIPDCVEDLSYKLNLLPFSNISFSNIILIFKKNK